MMADPYDLGSAKTLLLWLVGDKNLKVDVNVCGFCIEKVAGGIGK